MSLEVFGDGGDGGDLADSTARYNYEPYSDAKHLEGYWWNPKDDTNGDTIKTDEEMWEFIWDRRESEAEEL